jgi:hypothetical protein
LWRSRALQAGKGCIMRGLVGAEPMLVPHEYVKILLHR